MSAGRRATAAGDVPKSRRCVLAQCPLAGKRDPRCANCTGPVSWTDERGRRTGVGGVSRRRCTSCPMDGMGLPVCWAACDGPQDDFSTDGQKMVTLGGMPDPDGFVGRMSSDAGRGGGEGSDGMAMARFVLSRLLDADAEEWDAFRAACERRDAKSAAQAVGLPKGAFRGEGGGWDGSAVAMIMERIGCLDARAWDTVRRIALGDSQSRLAALEMVTKQAISARLKRMVRRTGWVEKVRGKK